MSYLLDWLAVAEGVRGSTTSPSAEDGTADAPSLADEQQPQAEQEKEEEEDEEDEEELCMLCCMNREEILEEEELAAQEETSDTAVEGGVSTALVVEEVHGSDEPRTLTDNFVEGGHRGFEGSEEGEANVFIITPCGHRLCRGCLGDHVRHCIEHLKYPIECAACSEELPKALVESLLDADEVQRLERLLLQKTLQGLPQYKVCPTPNCSFGCFVAVDQQKCPYVICPSCKESFCVMCCEKPHGTTACKLPELPHDVKPCPSCSTPIEKRDDGACNHIRCSVCKTDFCWLCGKQLTEAGQLTHYVSFNGCTMYGTNKWSPQKVAAVRHTSPLWAPVAVTGAMAVSPIIATMASIALGVETARKRRRRLNRIVVGTLCTATSLTFTVPFVVGGAAFLSVRGLYYAYVKMPTVQTVRLFKKAKRKRGMVTAPQPVVALEAH